MACTLKPECNLLYWYFRCLLPIETVDVEVKIKMMRGIHTFRRDWTTQVILCNPWSLRLHCYPSLIRKMKTYLELEGKLGNQTCTNIFSPDRNSLPQKTPVPKKAEKKKRAKMLVKMRFKVRVIAQPMPTNPTLPVNPALFTDPTPTVVTTMVTSTQMPVAKPTTTTTISSLIPVTVYNLAQGKFKGVPYPARKSQEEEGPSAPSGNNPPEEQQPKAVATTTALQNREDTPSTNTMPASDNLFVKRASCPIPPIMVECQYPPLYKLKGQKKGSYPG